MLQKIIIIIVPAAIGFYIFKDPRAIAGGVILGLIINFFNRYSDKSLIKKSDDFFEVTFSLMGIMANSDGEVCQDEARFTEEFFNEIGFSKEDKLKAIGFFKKGQELEISDYLNQLKRIENPSYLQRELLLRCLCQTAYSDGKIHKNENSLLIKVAWQLDFNKKELLKLTQKLKPKKDLDKESSPEPIES